MKCPICFKRFRKITNTLDICKRCHELYFEIGYKPLFSCDFTPPNFDFKKVLSNPEFLQKYVYDNEQIKTKILNYINIKQKESLLIFLIREAMRFFPSR